MAYVLGYLYADGSLEDASYLRGKYVRVSSTDKQTIIKIRRWLKSKHTIVSQRSTWKNGKTRYLLRIGSHKVYDTLTRLGLYPNKSLTVRLPAIPSPYLSHFVRGYFDGDGCVYVYKTRGRNRSLVARKLVVIFTSGSGLFLTDLGKVLKPYLRLNLERPYHNHTQRAYRLFYCTSDSIKLFKFMYTDCRKDALLPRKLNKFRGYFFMRPEKIDKTVKNILNGLKLAR